MKLKDEKKSDKLNRYRSTENQSEAATEKEKIQEEYIDAKHYVSAKFLRVDLPALQRDSLSGGSCGATKGFHILPFRLLQMRTLRHKADAQDVFQ